MIVQACRSWTPRTPSTREHVGAHVVQVDPARRGLEQDVERLAQQVPGAGQHEDSRSTTEATTSAAVHPVVAMTTAATMTATEPSASASTSR